LELGRSDCAFGQVGEHFLMFGILLVTTPALLGVGATYFAPLKLRPRVAFILSVAFAVFGIACVFSSFIGINQTKAMMLRWYESGVPDPDPLSQFDWYGLWLYLWFAGVFLAIFGLGACLGCGLRKFTSRLRV
jgi:hypothetical protein